MWLGGWLVGREGGGGMMCVVGWVGGREGGKGMMWVVVAQE